MDELDKSTPKKRKKTETFVAKCKDLGKNEKCLQLIMCDRRNPLIVQQITPWNAAAGPEVNFSRASWETCPFTSEIYAFGSLLLDDIHFLNDFFTEPEYAPGDRLTMHTKLLLRKLTGCCQVAVLDGWRYKVMSPKRQSRAQCHIICMLHNL